MITSVLIILFLEISQLTINNRTRKKILLETLLFCDTHVLVYCGMRRWIKLAISNPSQSLLSSLCPRPTLTKVTHWRGGGFNFVGHFQRINNNQTWSSLFSSRLALLLSVLSPSVLEREEMARSRDVWLTSKNVVNTLFTILKKSFFQKSVQMRSVPREPHLCLPHHLAGSPPWCAGQG